MTLNQEMRSTTTLQAIREVVNSCVTAVEWDGQFINIALCNDPDSNGVQCHTIMSNGDSTTAFHMLVDALDSLAEEQFEIITPEGEHIPFGNGSFARFVEEQN